MQNNILGNDNLRKKTAFVSINLYPLNTETVKIERELFLVYIFYYIHIIYAHITTKLTTIKLDFLQNYTNSLLTFYKILFRVLKLKNITFSSF